ncbi:tetratricopeptide repeat protein [Aminobacter sp. AP02]|uniref:tetratricopeptide repeat protein n=1 Tax=Aminobacter sp. AP02 TaxID=2135737 RepID=UPI000D6B008F|nr:tetratricopeptide repeat protein [Aminobacter sp. AP02]PWK76085.1 tetratricopeptide repeat protein [Aminobacter sp. AP02]
MKEAAGKIFGLVGALAAFPRRLAAREVVRQGGELQHGVTRRTTHVVLGRTWLGKLDEAKLEARIDAASVSGRPVLSENGFLGILGLLEVAEAPAMTRQALIDQSQISPRAFDLLALFDAFENPAEPYAFRDLILAKKYAGLLAGGATWSAIARSVHRSGPVSSLTALSLHVDGRDTIYARLGEDLAELDGQRLLPLGRFDDAELEDIFALAEEAEEDGRYMEAAALYGRCLASDPSDSVAAFNRANCLRAAGHGQEAMQSYLRAIKLDPKFVEAWFNLAGLFAAQGKAHTARRHLKKAVALDPSYADAVFNLANLEYEAGDLAEARRWWSLYLELDSTSEWARTAAKGIQYADLHLRERTAS